MKKLVPTPIPEAEVVVNHRTIVGHKRRAKTELKILTSALQVFAEKGPDAPVIDDFIKAAGIARGTFYNYFKSTNELLTATSTWLTNDLMESIEREIRDIEHPVIRLGIGHRLWMKKALTDVDWCGFVAKIWFQKGFATKAALRDIRLGLKLNELSCPTAECGWDIALGTTRQAMLRLLNDSRLNKAKYADQIVDAIVQGLGASRKLRAEIFAYQLPEMHRPTQTVKFPRAVRRT